MVADTILYHPTFGKLTRFLDSTPKREKCFRLVVYLSRFLSYYLQRQGFSPDVVNIFKDLKHHITIIRKGMRFLKPLNHLQAAAQTFDNKLMDRVLQKTTVIKNLGYVGYLSLDSITWLKLMNILSAKRFPTISTWSSRFWLIALIAGVINSLRTLKISNAKLEEKESEEINQKIYAAKRKLVWDFLDMFTCLNSLNYLHFTEGDVGLAGTITSIMGLHDLWKSSK